MKKLIFISATLIILISCNDSNDHSSKIPIGNSDSLKALSTAIERIKSDQTEASDSIKKYSLDSINNRCKSLLYVLYADDTLPGSKRKEIRTIGECNIALLGLESNSPNLKTLHYDYLIEDSIPILWKFDISSVKFKMIHSFVVDLIQKKIVKALITENISMQIKNVENAYDSIRKTKAFREYLSIYKNRIHPSFSEIISNLDSLSK